MKQYVKIVQIKLSWVLKKNLTSTWSKLQLSSAAISTGVWPRNSAAKTTEIRESKPTSWWIDSNAKFSPAKWIESLNLLVIILTLKAYFYQANNFCYWSGSIQLPPIPLLVGNLSKNITLLWNCFEQIKIYIDFINEYRGATKTGQFRRKRACCSGSWRSGCRW